MLNSFLLHMFIYPQKEFHFISLDYWHWHYYQSPWCKVSSNMNFSNILNVNDHIKLKTPNPKKKSHINYSAMEQVPFQKLHDIKLSHSVFRVTTSSNLTQLKLPLAFCFNMLMISTKIWKHYIQS